MDTGTIGIEYRWTRQVGSRGPWALAGAPEYAALTHTHTLARHAPIEPGAASSPSSSRAYDSGKWPVAKLRNTRVMSPDPDSCPNP